MCRHYIIGGYTDSDLQYYATVVLYGAVQSLSASTEEGADSMRSFFIPDDIFHPLLHLIRADSKELPTSFRLPTSHVREIRALLCGIFGSCFEKIVVNDFRTKLYDVRTIVRVLDKNVNFLFENREKLLLICRSLGMFPD